MNKFKMILKQLRVVPIMSSTKEPSMMKLRKVLINYLMLKIVCKERYVMKMRRMMRRRRRRKRKKGFKRYRRKKKMKVMNK